jgi:chromosome segregation ATPase
VSDHPTTEPSDLAKRIALSMHVQSRYHDVDETAQLVSTSGLADLEGKHAHLETVLDQSRKHVEDLEAQLAAARCQHAKLRKLDDAQHARQLTEERVKFINLEARLAAAELKLIEGQDLLDVCRNGWHAAIADMHKMERERDEARGKLHACESSRQSWMKLATTTEGGKDG